MLLGRQNSGRRTDTNHLHDLGWHNSDGAYSVLSQVQRNQYLNVDFVEESSIPDGLEGDEQRIYLMHTVTGLKDQL
eukprot:1746319-Amphidinium_carterae.1